MNILVDTNRYTDFAKGDQDTVRGFTEADHIYLPFVALAELRAGFACGKIARQNEATLVKFLNNKRVSVLYADARTTQVYAEIFAQLREQGTPIPTNDIWIAALAIQYALPLCSRDQHFEHLSQLARV